MTVDELLNFDYEASSKKSKTNPILRIVAIMFAAAFIFVMMPLIGRVGLGSEAFTAHAASAHANALTVETVSTQSIN